MAFHNFEPDPEHHPSWDTWATRRGPSAFPLPCCRATRGDPPDPYLQNIPPEVSWASLQVSYTAGQGSLTAAMVSTSQDGAHSIRSVVNWVEGSNREGWYWRADSQRDTLVSILNTDTQDARVAISLDYYQDGVAHSYDLPERTLPPGATSLLDIGAIITSGNPDANGKYYPLGVNFGGYHVRKIGQHIDKTITTEALVFTTAAARPSPPSTTPVAESPGFPPSRQASSAALPDPLAISTVKAWTIAHARRLT